MDSDLDGRSRPRFSPEEEKDWARVLLGGHTPEPAWDDTDGAPLRPPSPPTSSVWHPPPSKDPSPPPFVSTGSPVVPATASNNQPSSPAVTLPPTELLRLRRLVSELQMTVHRTDLGLAQSYAQIEALRQQTVAAEATKQRHAAEVEALRQHLRFLKATEKGGHETALAELRGSELQRMTMEADRLRQAFASVSRREEELQQSLEQTTEDAALERAAQAKEMERLNTEVAQAQILAQARDRKINELQTTHEAARVRMEERIHHLTQQLASESEETDALRRRMAEAKSQHDAMVLDSGEVQRQYHLALQRVEELERLQEDSARRLEGAAATIEGLSSQLRDLREADTTRAAALFDEAMAQVKEEHRREVHALREEMDGLRRRIFECNDASETARMHHEETVQRLRQDLEVMATEKAEVKAHLSRLLDEAQRDLQSMALHGHSSLSESAWRVREEQLVAELERTRKERDAVSFVHDGDLHEECERRLASERDRLSSQRTRDAEHIHKLQCALDALADHSEASKFTHTLLATLRGEVLTLQEANKMLLQEVAEKEEARAKVEAQKREIMSSWLSLRSENSVGPDTTKNPEEHLCAKEKEEDDTTHQPRFNEHMQCLSRSLSDLLTNYDRRMSEIKTSKLCVSATEEPS